MSITRKLLKGMGLTDEQVDTISEAHTETVDGLKADISRYKADAGKLAGVQKELDDLKAAGDGGYKSKYEKEHSDFEAFQSNITAKETKAAKEKAVRAFFESKNIQSIFARSIPNDLVILLRLVRKYDPYLTYPILCKQSNPRKPHDHAIFTLPFLQSVANGCQSVAIGCVPRAIGCNSMHLRVTPMQLRCAAGAMEALQKIVRTSFTFLARTIFYSFFQCFRLGTTASIWARTCSGGHCSFAMWATQKSISCAGLV